MSSFKFVYEDGQGKSVNENSSQALSYIVDEDYNGLKTIATHSQFLEARNRDRISEVSESTQTENQVGSPSIPPPKRSKTTRQRNTYTDEDIIKFFKLKDKKLLSAKVAAKQLNISARVAQCWIKKYDEDPDNLFNRGKKGGKKGLTNEHKKCIKEFVAEDASVYIKDMMNHLVSVFGKINMSKETVRRFMANECNLTFKKVYKQPVAKNSEENIEARYNWIL
ncbi:Homeodomain-like DNA binding domain-containing transcription factor [Phycomyces blakesleeanus NRRL 1555(-)]|uniref:Homeodomain-like DNA binding domain-containing transcription factor n=1 Tax=Phycomyces blakesleeanus (strain ATCC 8743b / DSM 1359 / FGSC 10004 / NBRC 33097 / NRRL 1555) TaxID=763407 RepID=A0A167MX59_PHYB8|nr:Homeodomain-like DNA binding domain-containing transcription factor [Phycomyces blakesleeanus NRRL 1555(-)]OAD74369.1 Homeodomain-like DNA binding domain-containing transcription factor [Phycomyces blakesleeanus NRRL 1555(-)]|eukprot:XP_018292409.1 Homeodomain-like DNA binding domain-containing transcription factor [Phycomyces blakesleeanus NRRL 1555(-)]